MKIVVLGAGAMGSVFGARLAMGGADVTLLDLNEAHLDAINHDGLSVALDDGTHIVHLPAMRPTDYSDPVDVVLLFTKIFHTDTALSAIASLLETATVFSLQNGIGNAERIKKHVPENRIILGMTLTPADFVGPGCVASYGDASTSFYSLDGQHRPVLDDLANALSAGGINTVLRSDIQTAIWEKAAFNCAMNAVCALTNGTPGSIGACEDGRPLALSVAREVVDVANASGVEASFVRVEAMMKQSFTQHFMHEPSMLQDRNAGRMTEIDALNGAVSGYAKKFEVSAPLNNALASLIRLSESTQRFRRQQDED